MYTMNGNMYRGSRCGGRGSSRAVATRTRARSHGRTVARSEYMYVPRGAACTRWQRAASQLNFSLIFRTRDGSIGDVG